MSRNYSAKTGCACTQACEAGQSRAHARNFLENTAVGYVVFFCSATDIFCMSTRAMFTNSVRVGVGKEKRTKLGT